jgi:sec-independent protein translocase protein TatA
MRMGFSELLVILAIVMLLFGAKKLPDLASGMGKAIRNFKKGVNEADDEDVTPADKQVTADSSATKLDSATREAAERKS